jgi:hypothetical protein
MLRRCAFSLFLLFQLAGMARAQELTGKWEGVVRESRRSIVFSADFSGGGNKGTIAMR